MASSNARIDDGHSARAHTAPVWRLHGTTRTPVECSVRQTPSTLYMVTVMRGSETFLDESYPDAASAMRRATQIREGLIKSGGWALA